MRHYIKKQVVQLLVDPGLDAFGVQQAASNYYWSEIVPVLERIFDELSAEGVTLRLEKLELDLGMLTEDLLRNKMKPDLYDRIRQQLRDMFLRPGRDKAITVFRESDAQHALKQWWHYMEHGRLHWSQSNLTAEWYRAVLEMLAVDDAAISQLKVAFGRNPRLLSRVCAQHGSAFLETLTGILVAEKQTGLGASIDVIVDLSRKMEELAASGGVRKGRQAAGKRTSLRKHLREWQERHREYLSFSVQGRREAVWRMILRHAAERPATFRAGGGVRLLAKWFWSEPVLVPQMLQEAGMVLPAGHPVLLPVAASAQRVAKRGGTENRREKRTEIDKDMAERGARGDEPATESRLEGDGTAIREAAGGEEDGGGTDRTRARTSDASAGDAVKEPLASGEREDAETPGSEGQELDAIEPGAVEELLFSAEDVDEEGSYIPNAGMILLHPFLSTCFSRLQWWSDGQFVDGAARQKAVFLLHFLATGRTEAPEYELVLPKVLCGYSPETQMPGRLELAPEEYAEADELLGMVLVRWDKMQGTSIEGLRESFLRREGKLFRRNDRLTLVVESHAIDVLLDYLPWNLSLVKLPWLQEILFVEWR